MKTPGEMFLRRRQTHHFPLRLVLIQLRILAGDSIAPPGTTQAVLKLTYIPSGGGATGAIALPNFAVS